MPNGVRARRAAIAALATTSALLLAGCGAANETAAPSGDGSQASGTIAGAGASSQGAAMQAWIAGFTGANPDATVTYDPVGSGGGRTQFADGAVAFAGSDAALKDDQLTKAQTRCGGGPDAVIELPLYISPIAIAYKLEGVSELNLKPATLAGIFAQKIKNWNDPAIAADNPGVTLPDLAITAVNRSDESGTTENFTEYLHAVAPEVWTFEPDGVWPVSGGAAAQGTSGVVGAISAGNGTIGYADASQVGQLGKANIGVGSEFVGPSAEAAAKIVSESPQVQGGGKYTFVYELARDTTASGTYPIVLVSYILACNTYQDAAQGDLTRAFIAYIASPEGQQAGAQNAGSAPISDELRAEFQPALDAIGGPLA
ncbi:phosphate ABC transporter substrate-binding protein PstS [Pseudonocardia sp.]|uniref:phosphate ABC transporter substrate-binding protein PstS n=1 Tax=Pseudonocardia sp. TaxID=60912 RepID=UPI003D12523F